MTWTLTGATAINAWVERELDDGSFPDRRLRQRLGTLLGDLGRRVGGTLPAACQDWTATKAAYRFFSNPRVDEGSSSPGTSPPPGPASTPPPARSSSRTTRPSSASRATIPR